MIEPSASYGSLRPIRCLSAHFFIFWPGFTSVKSINTGGTAAHYSYRRWARTPWLSLGVTIWARGTLTKHTLETHGDMEVPKDYKEKKWNDLLSIKIY